MSGGCDFIDDGDDEDDEHVDEQDLSEPALDATNIVVVAGCGSAASVGEAGGDGERRLLVVLLLLLLPLSLDDSPELAALAGSCRSASS